jgi:cytochrome oxidase Cu insertion factor (SCO1/SenC/PrrC family)
MTNSEISSTSARRKWTLIAILAVSIAPVLASYLSYYVWKPQGGKSYGDMLTVKSVIDTPLQTMDGRASSFAEFKGKWLLVMANTSQCSTSCMETLFALRQFRLAQGKNMHRVERLWLVTDVDTPNMEAVKQADGAQIRRIPSPVPLPGDVADSYYLLDPLGNQVLRYSRMAEPNKVIKELGKLLKNNEALG